MNKKLIEIVKKKFYTGLEQKTGWGRNDVKALFETCVAEAALELLDSE